MKNKLLVGLLSLHLTVSFPISPSNFVLVGNMKNQEVKIQSNFERLDERIEKLKKEKEIENLQKERIQEEKEFKRIQQIRKQKEKERKEAHRKRSTEYEEKYSNVRDVVVDITYFFAEDSDLQGGHLDKKGKPLNSFDYAVCALPSDVSYGSILVLEEPVVVNTSFNKSNKLINVDTGGAIVWKGQNYMRVDVFVKNCSNLDWIVRNLENKHRVNAKLYFK